MNNFEEILRKTTYAVRHNYSKLTNKLNRNVIRIGNRTRIDALNEWQSAFCAWYAERAGQPEAVVRDRLLHSTNSVKGGHGGADYRRFGALSYAIYLPFASDDEGEVVDAYQFHAHMHFLRMLSYPIPRRPADHPVHKGIDALDAVTVIDFGCGLAQKSISLIREAQSRGKKVHLRLADVSKLQLEFLAWFCARNGIPAETFHCTANARFPDFAPADVLFAEEVLEHVHDPVAYVEALDRLIAPRGYMIANLSEHKKEFMHVSPNLGRARARLLELGYQERQASHVFQKSADHPVRATDPVRMETDNSRR